MKEIYESTISFHDITNQIFLCDSNYIVHVVTWQKVGSSSIFIRKVHNLNFVGIRQKKTKFYEEYSWFKINNLGVAQCMALKIDNNVEKGFKLKVIKFWGIIDLIFGNYII